MIELYRKQMGEVFTVAVGDRLNDLPMLKVVDCPIAVQVPGGGYDPGISVPRLLRAKGIGPEGWRDAILELVEKLKKQNDPGTPLFLFFGSHSVVRGSQEAGFGIGDDMDRHPGHQAGEPSLA